VSITVHEARTREQNRLPEIELTVRPAGEGPPRSEFPVEPVPTVGSDSLQQHLEILDDQGRLVPWYQSRFDGETGRVTLTISGFDRAPSAREIRYYGLVRATAVAQFVFHGLPMP
jgi:hypothetical protein